MQVGHLLWSSPSVVKRAADGRYQLLRRPDTSRRAIKRSREMKLPRPTACTTPPNSFNTNFQKRDSIEIKCRRRRIKNWRNTLKGESVVKQLEEKHQKWFPGLCCYLLFVSNDFYRVIATFFAWIKKWFDRKMWKSIGYVTCSCRRAKVVWHCRVSIHFWPSSDGTDSRDVRSRTGSRSGFCAIRSILRIAEVLPTCI